MLPLLTAAAAQVQITLRPHKKSCSASGCRSGGFSCRSVVFASPTVFILISAPGALQFTSPKNDVLETKCGQIYKKFSVLKPFWMTFGNLLPIKSGRGGAFTREGAFIRTNKVLDIEVK